jgi:uracil-DNA glycosylase family 4
MERDGIAVPCKPAIAHGEQLAFIAEAPGYVEAQRGEPLVGKVGHLFDNILAACGLDRDDVFLTYRVRCRPPRNDLEPYPDALLACEQWMRPELDAGNITVGVLLGRTAYEPVFGDRPVWSVAGKHRQTTDQFRWGARAWVASWHPAAALRRPDLTEQIGEHIAWAVDLAARSR